MGFIAAIGRRGASISQPPPPAGTYGPTAGRQAVINGAGPRTVTDPGGGITFTTRSGLQTAINGNPAGSVFVFTGTTLDLDARVFTEDKAPTIIFPTGKIIDGGNRDYGTGLAFGGVSSGSITPSPYTVRGGTWQNFGATDAASLAVFTTATAGTIIEDIELKNVLKLNGNGIDLRGGTVRFAKVHDIGKNAFGSGSSNSSLITNVECFNNGGTWGDAAPADGGTGKLYTNSSVSVEYCYFHNEDNFSIWCDNGNTMNVRESVIEDCRKAGPMYELCQQGGEIYRCWLARNGETELINNWFSSVVSVIACSPNSTGLEVHFNHMEGAERIFCLNNQLNRLQTKNVDIHDNRFKFTNAAARIGGHDTQTTRTLHTEPSITWSNNRYQFVGALIDPVHLWPSATSSQTTYTWAQWQASGRDTGSVREVV